MAVKGAQAKANITEKILETFPGSFVYEKEIRVPYVEDGVNGQIKIVLTAAKNLIESDSSDSITENSTNKDFSEVNEKIPQEPSTEEKERLKILLDKLGL